MLRNKAQQNDVKKQVLRGCLFYLLVVIKRETVSHMLQ